MLVLFDIDGTMLSSEGVGVRSIEETCEKMFGKPCSLEGIPVGGRLDPLIWNDVCAKYKVHDADGLHATFRKQYTEVLRKNLQQVDVTVLQGVKELIAALGAMEQVALGLVTGNYEETGKMKVEQAGFDSSIFAANAWGTDGKVRNDLPPVAIAKYGKGGPVVLLGDTIHDVTSGKSSGCKVIAVCTGSHDRAILAASDPDLLLEDLTETEAVLHWIFNIHNQ